MLCIIPRAAADGDAPPLWVGEIPVAAFATTVHKAGIFQVGDQLSHLARHFSIKIVSLKLALVNCSENKCRVAFKVGILCAIETGKLEPSESLGSLNNYGRWIYRIGTDTGQN